MRAVAQRVTRARVRVGETTTGEIGNGLLALVSVGTDDDDGDARAMAEKLVALRVFPDDEGRMNRSVLEAGGALLLISQFTLHGDARHGRRPSFIAAAKEPQARRLFDMTGAAAKATGLSVAYGEFGAAMEVELVNSGPVTILLDTKRLF